MAVPVLLVSGYLGAGKTTLINRLLTLSGGRRIAAIVNDFGAIDIDAALLGSAVDGVVSLKNGCICCTLQGDLLRALSTVMKRDPGLEAIVIETSGVSDPAEIIRNLLDPVIFKAAALDTVACIVDARQVAEAPELAEDALWQSQLRSADFVLLSKTDLVDAGTLERLRRQIHAAYPAKPIFDAGEALDPSFLFSHALHEAASDRPSPRPVSLPQFATASWRSQRPLSLPRFQSALNHLSRRLLRAKGLVVFTEYPGQPMLVQLVGTRATVTPSPVAPEAGLMAEIVLIAKDGQQDLSELTDLLDAAAGPSR